jgi:hypothetical protein
MNVEIGAEAALFPEKEYKKGDFRCSVWLVRLPAARYVVFRFDSQQDSLGEALC